MYCIVAVIWWVDETSHTHIHTGPTSQPNPLIAHSPLLSGVPSNCLLSSVHIVYCALLLSNDGWVGWNQPCTHWGIGHQMKLSAKNMSLWWNLFGTRTALGLVDAFQFIEFQCKQMVILRIQEIWRDVPFTPFIHCDSLLPQPPHCAFNFTLLDDKSSAALR